MVSSELVVLLIVCVGINTGSAQQEYCQDGSSANRICSYNSNFDTNTDCMDTTLECVNSVCSAVINNESRLCISNTYNEQTVNISIRCCFCNNSIGNTPQPWWNCGNTSSSAPSSLLSPSTVVLTTLQSSTMVTTPTATMMTTDAINSAAIVVPVVVVLVVCLLVVCAIATIIILYQRAKHHQQDTTNDYDKTLHQLDNTLYTTSAPQNDGLYNHTHHGHTTPPPIYSTLAEGGAPADYSTIVDKEGPTGEYSEIQLPPDTSNEGLVYSAVVVKDDKKTTVKTIAQTSSTSDTVQPAEGMVYSAVIRQDGKKISVKD